MKVYIVLTLRIDVPVCEDVVMDVMSLNRYGGGSVMISGAVNWNHKSGLVVIWGNLNVQRYFNEILRPIVLPRIRSYNLIFQQDNAGSCTARISTDFINIQNTRNLPWPARSPDLLPVEHVLDIFRA